MRGRISSMDRLPPGMDRTRDWAIKELRERRLWQQEILDRVNAEAAGLGLTITISRSAFQRWASLGLQNGFAIRGRRKQLPLRCPKCGHTFSTDRGGPL